MKTDKLTQQLLRNGFVKLPFQILNQNERQALHKSADELLTKKIDEKGTGYVYHQSPRISSGVISYQHVLGLSKDLDAILSKILLNKDVTDFLERIFGSEYHTWQIAIRRSTIELDKAGLPLHQDSIGEAGLIILLNNTTTAGATCLIPGSHKFTGAPALSLFSRMPWFILSPFLSKIKGTAGDMFFFFNDTWHGRMPNKTQHRNDCMIISFYGQGYNYGPYKLPKAATRNVSKKIQSLISAPQEWQYNINDYLKGKRIIDQVSLGRSMTRPISFMRKIDYALFSMLKRLKAKVS